MPKCNVTMTGEIQDFDRLDNVYNNLKREGAKLLKNWEIKIQAEFTEKQEQ